MSGSVVNLFLVYQFLRRLVTPFNQWEAFKEGIIDERGNIVIKAKDRHSLDQKRSFQKFDLLVLKLKKLLEKVPGGKSRLASYAAALYLIKEDWDQQEVSYLEEADLEDRFNSILESLEEDGIANVASGGDIAGMGYGGKDDVLVPKRAKSKYIRKNKKEAEKLNRAFEELEANNV